MPVVDSDRHEDSGEMYSPDEQGEYALLDGTPRFSMQGLSNALADVREGITEPPVEEYDVGGDNGRSSWVAASTHFLLECRNGNACIEEQPGP